MTKKFEAVILRSANGQHLTKVYSSLDAKPKAYQAGKYVYARGITCDTFAEFVDEIARIKPDECLIRGGLVADARPIAAAGERVRRLAYDRPKDDCLAAFEAVDRNWIVLDADETDVPFRVGRGRKAANEWLDTLPDEIRDAPMAFFLSASAHRSKTVRGKLIVALRKPLSNVEAAAWAKAHGFDGSVCHTVQPNYFAPPIFEGCADPLAKHRAPIVRNLDGKPALLKVEASARSASGRRILRDATDEPIDRDAEPTERARKLAKAIGKRWLEGDRIETNAWLHICGWCLGKGWTKTELYGLLMLLDSDEPDDAKVVEHLYILGNARAIEGPGNAREWLGKTFKRADKAVSYNAQLQLYKGMRAERAADVDADADPFHAVEAPELVLATDKGGKTKATPANAAAIIEHAFGDRIRYEAFSGRTICNDVPAEWDHFPDGQWTDVHTTSMQIYCNSVPVDFTDRTMAACVVRHAKKHEYNALRDWLMECALKWDGTARVDSAMSTYWGATDTPATRAASRVFLLSLAARGLEPGCKVDTALVLIGAQGIRKSTSLRALAGAAWFSDSPLAIGSLDGMQIIRGRWLWELAEYASVSTRDRNTVKQFMSSAVDVFRASYGRFSEEVPRQTCFAITTNDAEILNDPTGARRFLPVTIEHRIDTDAIARDREQLLGEAAHRILVDGEAWWPTEEEDAALDPVRRAATELSVRHDPWEEPIETWIADREGKPFAMGELTDPITGAVPIPLDRLDKRAQMRLANTLRMLGYERVRKRSAGARSYVWRQSS